MIVCTNARIDLSVKDLGDSVLISVADNGKPVDPLRLKKLVAGFETTKPNGSGFGLVIVSEILMQIGGNLSFEALKEGGLNVMVKLLKTDER